MNPKFLQQAQQLQQRLAKAQQELANETVTATAGGGAITIEITGDLHLRSVKLSPEIVDPDDVEMLQDLLLAAFNEAIQKSQQLQQQRLGAITGGMRIPGLM